MSDHLGPQGQRQWWSYAIELALLLTVAAGVRAVLGWGLLPALCVGVVAWAMLRAYAHARS